MHQERKKLAFGVRKEAIYVILNDVRLPCLNENKTADNINTNTSHKKIVKSSLNYWMSPASLKCCQMFPKSFPPPSYPLHPSPSQERRKRAVFLESSVSGSVSPPGHLLLLVSSLALVSEWQECRQSCFLFLFQRGLGVGLAQSTAGWGCQWGPRVGRCWTASLHTGPHWLRTLGIHWAVTMIRSREKMGLSGRKRGVSFSGVF